MHDKYSKHIEKQHNMANKTKYIYVDATCLPFNPKKSVIFNLFCYQGQKSSLIPCLNIAANQIKFVDLFLIIIIVIIKSITMATKVALWETFYIQMLRAET